jgi:hypothetical protein
MEPRNKTLKRPSSASNEEPVTDKTVATATADDTPDPFRNLLDESAREAFRRPWHRLERGLRLNRLRMYVEEMSAQCSFNTEEKNRFFIFLQNALDRKLLNTHKIVEYLPEMQKIKSIKGLEVRRLASGEAKWGFVRAKKTDGTRRIRRPTTVATAATTAATTEKVEES